MGDNRFDSCPDYKNKFGRLEYLRYICRTNKLKTYIMANEVTKVFSNMSDEELVLVIQEMKEDGPQGIVRMGGIVREKCKMVQAITGGNAYEHMMTVQFSILQEAAYRFTPTMDELTHNV